MKKFAIIFSALLFLAGCTSTDDEFTCAQVADSLQFEYYYPNASRTLVFDTMDEAENWIKEAKYKFEKTIAQRPAKGLAARLAGPKVRNDDKVTVSYFITIDGKTPPADSDETLDSFIRKATGTSIVFLVFQWDRGASISNYYIDAGYAYTNNLQYSGFRYGEAEYRTDYPIGWSMRNAFLYIAGEID